MTIDFSKMSERSQILSEIRGQENLDRKDEGLKKWEFYFDRHEPYIYKDLHKQYDKDTVSSSRNITSINLTKRVIDAQASIYTKEPVREFVGAEEREEEQLNALYEEVNVNVLLKNANKIFKLYGQCAIQVIPKNNTVMARLLAPHQFDVVPDPENPHIPLAYIINISRREDILRLRDNDEINQKIADKDDFKRKQERFVWWTDTDNFITDGNGFVIEQGENPLGRLPFIDITEAREAEYWVRSGCSVVNFSSEFIYLLCDVAEVNRLQGFSQAVISAEKIPDNIKVGPSTILHLPLDSKSTQQPSFEFVSPSPDMDASLKLLETYVSFFLSSQGIDPQLVSSSGGGRTFNSGFERLLAMFERFEASQDDFDVFKQVELKLFDLLVDWSNLLQNVTNFNPRLQQATISDDVFLSIEFAGPELIETNRERCELAVKQLEAGLMTQAEAIAFTRNIDIEKAEEIAEEINGQGRRTQEEAVSEEN